MPFQTLNMSALNYVKSVVAEYCPDHTCSGIFGTMNRKIGLNVTEIGFIFISSQPSISMPVTSITSSLRFSPGTRYVSVNVPNSWVCFDCRKWWIQPTHYRITSGPDETMQLRSWILEGSNDRVRWFLLDERRMDVDKKPADSVYKCMDFNCFRYFKIVQTSPNSSGTNNLAIAQFDIFGEARQRDSNTYIPSTIQFKDDE